MICFYHRSDFDGKASAAIVKMKYPDCRLIGVNYGKPEEMFFDKNPPKGNMIFENENGEIELVSSKEVVFVVDYCFREAEMVALDLFAKLIWIDHHKSSIDTMAQYEFNGVQKNHLAACELVWMCLYPELKMPDAIRLLGAYDTWRFKGHESENEYKDVLPFQYGLRMRTLGQPNDGIWAKLLVITDPGKADFRSTIIFDICKIGKIVLAYEDQTNAKIAQSMAFECEFHGHRAIALNRPWIGSKAFDAVYDPAKHDLMILFSTKGDGNFKHSLFCDKPEIDVSALAQKYPGGGGHAGAAGFTADSIQVTTIRESAKKIALKK